MRPELIEEAAETMAQYENWCDQKWLDTVNEFAAKHKLELEEAEEIMVNAS